MNKYTHKIMLSLSLVIAGRVLRINCKRYFCVEQENIRVRFAPSPTGYLHLGGLRTALYNYLFSKASSGKFILRIEDTDQTRLVENASEQLEDDLKWAGIIPDESPRQGGPFGPYKQSQRLPLYKQHAEILVESSNAYRCFCTTRRLELIRQEAARTRQIPRYDNRCRHLTVDEVNAKLREGQPHCIRLKLGTMGSWDDLILGQVNHDITVEGDPILLKTDGFPTYHLACVVDDHLMKVTHVLRGVEWQVSTPKHLQIYQAFQWQPPQFGHLPLLLNSDGTKLSKRQGGVTVAEQRLAGVYPRTLVTWLTLAGGGFPHVSGSSTGLHSGLAPMSPYELVPHFDLSRVHPASCRLPLEKLPMVNQLEIERQLKSRDEAYNLASELSNILKQHYAKSVEENSLHIEKENVLEVLQWALPRIHYLNDFLKPELAFLWKHPSQPTSMTEKETKALRSVCSVFEKLPQANYERAAISKELKSVASSLDMPFSHLMKLLRFALSGLKQGPSVAEMFELLGPKISLVRLKAAISSAHAES